MAKPKEVFLLEVSWPEGSPYNAKGGGIFRTERDMRERIKTVRYKAMGKPFKLTTYRLEANWEEYNL